MALSLITGEDVLLTCTLEDYDPATCVATARGIDSAATVTAVIRNSSGTLSDTVNVLEATTGSDWENGVIIIVFTDTETAAVTEYGLKLLEVAVDDSGVSKWLFPVTITAGLL